MMSPRRSALVAVCRAVVVVAVLAWPLAARAQAWTRDAGHTYVNLSVTRLSGNKYYGPNFARVPIVRYRQLTLGLYGEVGLVDRYLMLSVASELWRENRLEGAGKTAGLGDTRVGLWTGLLVDPFRLTVGFTAGLPTGDDAPAAGPGVDEVAILTARSLPTGDGELDLEPKILFGASFGGGAWPLGHYVVADAGYSLRTRGFHDAVTYRLELGSRLLFAPLDRVWVVMKVFGVESFASNREAAGSFSGLGDGVTHTSASLQLAAHIWGGFGMSLAADTAFRARGVISATPIRLGVSFEH